MITAGINVGAENVEVVILQGEKLSASSIVRAGWDTNAAIQKAFDDAIQVSGMKKDEITTVGVSGIDSINVGFPTAYFNDLVCSARGATWLLPSARTVIDVGAENSSALSCDDTGRLLKHVRSGRCAAGTGMFMEEMASLMELKVEDFGELSLLSKKQIPMSSTCAVFAESEVISLVHQGVGREDIIRAISDAVVSRTVSLLQAIETRGDIVFIGGVAKNVGIADSLSKKLRIDIRVPEEPSIVTAIGAALIAQQQIER